MLRIISVLALVAIAPVSGAAQQIQDVSEGIRVRIDGEHVGTVSDVSSDTLVVRADDHGSGSWSVARRDIDKLELSRGTKRHWQAGGILGMAVGFLAGLAAGPSSCGDDGYILTEGQCRVVSATMFAAGGLAVGALIGGLITTERWEEVQLTVAPTGVALGVSVPF